MSLADEFARVCATPSDIVDHLPRLAAMVNDLDATHVIELGTRTGVSTIAWLYALERRGRLTSVDLDPRPPIGEYDHWDFIRGDDLDPAVIDQLDVADIVFIDTSHHWAQTVAELETYLRLVRPGGRIVLHDTQLRRPEGSPARPLFPVRTAIRAFVEAHKFEWFEYLDSHGLGVIEIPKEA